MIAARCVTVILLVRVVGAIFAAGAIGNRKGRRRRRFLLGLFLGWIGVIIIALIPPTRDMLVLRERERLQIQREAAEYMGVSRRPGPRCSPAAPRSRPTLSFSSISHGRIPSRSAKTPMYRSRSQVCQPGPRLR